MNKFWGKRKSNFESIDFFFPLIEELENDESQWLWVEEFEKELKKEKKDYYVI